MTTRMSAAEFKAIPKKRSKYGNRALKVDGIRFDSTLEANRYLQLKDLRAAGAVHWFLMQVPFRLPGGIIYRADFMVRWAGKAVNQGGDHSIYAPITVEDCKGFMTRVSANKIKQVDELYGITVQIITKAKK